MISFFKILNSVLPWKATDNGDGTATPLVSIAGGGLGQALNFRDEIAVNEAVVSLVPCNLHVIYGANMSGVTGYAMIFDANAAPLDGVAPTTTPIPIASGGTFSLDFGSNYRAYTTGLYVCLSTTFATKTLSGAGAFYFTAGLG